MIILSELTKFHGKMMRPFIFKIGKRQSLEKDELKMKISNDAKE